MPYTPTPHSELCAYALFLAHILDNLLDPTSGIDEAVAMRCGDTLQMYVAARAAGITH